jgi:hypothetical protein
MKQAFDLERPLAIRRVAQPKTVVSGPETARAARVLIDLERATLEKKWPINKAKLPMEPRRSWSGNLKR